MKKSEQKIFTFVHPTSKDVFTYNDAEHEYKLNGGILPGTTTPLQLVNELSWDEGGKMTSKMDIIKNWALKLMYTTAVEKIREMFTGNENQETYRFVFEDFEKVLTEAKKSPNQRFKDAGISGTEIHAEIERIIKHSIELRKDGFLDGEVSDIPQVQNFITWAVKNKVKFLFSEEPLYSKEWMNCGTVDFVCEINGKILVGDIKTNGDKRRYGGTLKFGKWIEDKTKPQSDIHIPALWQTGAYGKMMTEEGARKLIDKFDGVVIINIKKSGEFDESIDVRYDYNVDSLIRAYDHVIWLYKEFRNKYNQ